MSGNSICLVGSGLKKALPGPLGQGITEITILDDGELIKIVITLVHWW